MATVIKGPSPHMVLNSHNVPPPDYYMDTTWKVPDSTPVSQMIRRIAEAARATAGGTLTTVVFNSHGLPGHISLGVGIYPPDAAAFAGLNGLVKRIWFVACRVADDYRETASAAPDGKAFCRDVAVAAEAYVTAGSANQTAGKMCIAPGYIDEWVGEVFTFNPQGAKTSRVVHVE